MNATRLLGLGFFVAVSSLFAKSATEVAKSTFPSTVLIMMQDQAGQPLSMGSGFVLKPGAIVTNVHVIEGASRGYVKQIGTKTKHNVEGVLRIDKEHDLAILSVPSLSAPEVALGDSAKLAVGDTIYAVGNPEGLEGTFSPGIVSGIRKVGPDMLLQITAPISSGSSGGPVVNELGEVIGVAVATFKEGQNLNFAIPSSYLMNIALAAKPTKLSSATSQKSSRSLVSGMGATKPSDAIHMDNLVWDDDFLGDGNFTVTIRNVLKQPVQNIYCLVIFHDQQGSPLDFTVVRYSGIIPGGLAKRVKGRVDSSVKKLTTDPKYPGMDLPAVEEAPSTKTIFRVLNFAMASE